MMRIDRVDLLHEQADEAAFRVETQGRGEPHGFVAQVTMQQVQRADPDTEEEEALAELEDADHQ